MASEFTDLPVIVGRNIKARRKELHKSQTELALDIGSDKASVSRIENGKQEISVSMLGWIAEALETEPSFLAEREQGRGTAETEVLSVFRSLSEADQAAAVAMLRGLAAQEKYKS